MADQRENNLVVIVGAGLVGAMTAVTLAQRGFEVKLYEKRDNWRRTPEAIALAEGEEQSKNAVKRSINLALSYRGQSALKNVGVLDSVMEEAIPMRCRAIHSLDKQTTEKESDPDSFQPYDEVDASNAIYSISRERINNLLLDKAESMSGVDVYFNHKLVKIKPDGTAVLEGEGKTFEVSPRLIIGSDGAYSAVRDQMLRLLKVHNSFTRTYISHGYKELNIPPTESGEFALSCPEALHIWPRGKFMLIGLPNSDKSFTCTLFAPFHDEEDEDGEILPGMLEVQTPEQIEKYFTDHFPDVRSVMPNFIEDYQRNPASKLVRIQVRPWNYEDKVLVLGDAAHAMVPFYGQGMNSGFEDVLVLDETLDEVNNDISKAIELYALRRQADGEAINELSMRNYIEMRHHSGDPMFRFRKKIEGVLNWILPSVWIPLYKMVAFTRIPYSQAITRGEKQDKILLSVQSVVIAAFTSVAAYIAVDKLHIGEKISDVLTGQLNNPKNVTTLTALSLGYLFIK